MQDFFWDKVLEGGHFKNEEWKGVGLFSSLGEGVQSGSLPAADRSKP